MAVPAIALGHPEHMKPALGRPLEYKGGILTNTKTFFAFGLIQFVVLVDFLGVVVEKYCGFGPISFWFWLKVIGFDRMFLILSI